MREGSHSVSFPNLGVVHEVSLGIVVASDSNGFENDSVVRRALHDGDLVHFI